MKELKERKEVRLKFEEIQKDLLRHKYLYYIKCAPVIQDYDYDMMERESLKLAYALGYRADNWEGPDDDEKDHVHWMVGFDEKHPLWAEIKSISEGTENKGA